MADAQNNKSHLRRGAGENHFSRAAVEKNLGADRKWSEFSCRRAVPGALVNYAALLCGKVPVNLNYTLSEATLASCAKQCELKTVITSRIFLEKVKLTLPGEIDFSRRRWRSAEHRLGAKPVNFASRRDGARRSVGAGKAHRVPDGGPSAVATWLERALSSNRHIGNRQSAIPGLPRHRDFFQRQHRRAERRDALALQHRRQHRTIGPGV